MGTYYIVTRTGDEYELQSTSNVKISYAGEPTDNTIESGDSVSDHYIHKATTLSLQGTITDVVFTDEGRNTRSFTEGLKELKLSKTPFTFVFGNKIGVIPNCVFTSLDISQDSRRGKAGDLDSFMVSMNLKQLRLAKQASLRAFRDPLIRDDAEEKGEGKGTTKEPEVDAGTRYRETITVLASKGGGK